MIYNKNGIPFLTNHMVRNMKRGCNTGQCPPPALSTPYPDERTKGVTGGNIPKRNN